MEPIGKKANKWQKAKPMSNEEFKQLLRSIKKKDESAIRFEQKPNKVLNVQSISLTPRPHKMWRPMSKLANTKQNVLHDLKLTIKCRHTTPCLQVNHMFNETGRKQSLDQLLQEKNKNIWQIALSTKLVRLVQGVQDIQSSDAIDFIPFHQVPPQGLIVTYANMVCDICPLKTEKYRVRLTVRGDRLQYPDDTASPAA